MSQQAIMKVFFEHHERSEIRKFMLSESQMNYTNFATKVQTVFPALEGKEFSIQWRDDVGDFINVSSDEELKIAAMEMGNDETTYVFHVRLVGEQSKSGTANEAANDPIISVEIDLPNLSNNCICDHCDIPIRQVRYKCLQCNDYDLCNKCEALGIHPTHFMLRIPVDSNWRHKVNNILRKFMENTAYLNAAEKHAQRHGRKCGQNRRPCRRIAKAEEAMKYFGINLKDLMSSVDADAVFGLKTLVLDGMKEAFEKYSTELVNDSESEESPKKNKKASADQQKDECTECQKEPSTSYDGDSDKAETVDEWMLLDDNETGNADDKTKSKIPEVVKSCTKKKESTDVSKSETSHTPETAPESVTNKNAEEKKEKPLESYTSSDKIYPDLDDADRIFHPDPKVQAAARTLMDMGFTNRGGILTQLASAHGGNVEKVVNILLKP